MNVYIYMYINIYICVIYIYVIYIYIYTKHYIPNLLVTAPNSAVHPGESVPCALLVSNNPGRRLGGATTVLAASAADRQTMKRKSPRKNSKPFATRTVAWKELGYRSEMIDMYRYIGYIGMFSSRSSGLESGLVPKFPRCFVFQSSTLMFDGRFDWKWSDKMMIEEGKYVILISGGTLCSHEPSGVGATNRSK